jgi:plastocyanin
VQVTVTDRVTVGDPLEASATIRNTGSVGSQSLSVGLDTDQDGTLDDTEVETSVRRTLDGDETRTVTFSLETSGLDPGQFDLVVRSANDSGTAETLLEPDFPPAPPSNPANGDGTGDPHLTTFDGVSYDFQAAGEFVLAREPSGSLAVQGRLVPVSNRAVSVIEAVATTLDGRNVTIDAADSTPLTVSGVDQPLADGDNVTVGNGTVFRRGDTFVVIYPGEDDRLSDGDERLRVDVRGDRVDVRVVLDDQRTKAVEGLLGSPNGNRTDDIAYANGTALDRPLSLGELYGPYRADYRVTSDTSLFDYDAGESTAGFFLPDYPGEIVTVESLDEDERRAAAEQAREAGLTPGTPAFENAVLDFALTGDPSYIQSASESVATNATADVTTRSSDRILVTATTDGATSLGPNETLRIPVEIDTGDRSVYAVQADLRYDTNVLDVVSVSNGSFLGPDAITVAERINDSAGRVRYGATATGDADVSGAGTLLTVTARVNGSAEAGASTRLRLTGVGLSDRNGARVNATVRGTAVSVATVDLPNLTASPERDVNYAGRRVPISVNAGGADLARIEAAPTRAPERARGISCAGGPPCSGTVGVTATGPTWNATTQSYEETSFRVTAVTENGRRVTRTVRTTVRLPGDVNPDGTVDILDAVQLGQGWRSRAGGPDYSSAADLTGDGRVDVFDAVVLGQNFGRQTASGAGNESDTSEPTETFEITNIGASYYEVDGAEQPILTLQRGETYRFNVSASGHPFHVSTDPNGGDLGDIYTEGVEVSSPAEMNGGAVEDGTLTFTVPESAPDTLYYQCGVHAGMGAEIVVEG